MRQQHPPFIAEIVEIVEDSNAKWSAARIQLKFGGLPPESRSPVLRYRTFGLRDATRAAKKIRSAVYPLAERAFPDHRVLLELTGVEIGSLVVTLGFIVWGAVARYGDFRDGLDRLLADIRKGWRKLERTGRLSFILKDTYTRGKGDDSGVVKTKGTHGLEARRKNKRPKGED